MSSLANIILFIALVTTSAIVAVMYRKLKRLDAYHAEYTRIFDKTGEALIDAQKAVSSFGSEGKETLVALGVRIEEAKALIERLDTLNGQIGHQTQARPNNSNSQG